MQVLAELIISNESRIIESNSVSFYNRMRSFKFTATIRYQVQVQPCNLMQSTLILVHSVACCCIKHETPCPPRAVKQAIGARDESAAATWTHWKSLGPAGF